MKSYFEIPYTTQQKAAIIAAYDDVSLEQHSDVQQKKIAVKLSRIQDVVTFSEQDIVVDIGCSRGYLLSLLSSHITKGIGLDISKSVLAENKKQVSGSNIRFQAYDGTHITIEETPTKILMIDILEHVFDPDALMREVHRTLHDTGELIIQVPFTGWLSELVTREHHQGHLRYYDPLYLVRYLDSVGFAVTKTAVYNTVPGMGALLRFPRIWRLFDRLVNLIPSSVYPYFGEILVVAKKTV